MERDLDALFEKCHIIFCAYVFHFNSNKRTSLRNSRMRIGKTQKDEAGDHSQPLLMLVSVFMVYFSAGNFHYKFNLDMCSRKGTCVRQSLWMPPVACASQLKSKRIASVLGLAWNGKHQPHYYDYCCCYHCVCGGIRYLLICVVLHASNRHTWGSPYEVRARHLRWQMLPYAKYRRCELCTLWNWISTIYYMLWCVRCACLYLYAFSVLI